MALSICREDLLMSRTDGAYISRDGGQLSSQQLGPSTDISQRLVYRPKPVRVLEQLLYVQPSVLYIFKRPSPMSTA